MAEKIKVFEEKTGRSSSLLLWLLPLLLLALLAFWWLGRRHDGDAGTAAKNTAAPASDLVKPDGGGANAAWTADTIASSLQTKGRVGFNDADVHFATGSAALAGDSQAVLDQTAQALRNNADWKIRIVGHTDSTGSKGLNDQLAQQRATAVMAYLGAHGVAQSRLSVDAKGETEPAATNGSNLGRAENRRVELIRQ